jgi:hypothetical protein
VPHAVQSAWLPGSQYPWPGHLTLDSLSLLCPRFMGIQRAGMRRSPWAWEPRLSHQHRTDRHSCPGKWKEQKTPISSFWEGVSKPASEGQACLGWWVGVNPSESQGKKCPPPIPAENNPSHATATQQREGPLNLVAA